MGLGFRSQPFYNPSQMRNSNQIAIYTHVKCCTRLQGSLTNFSNNDSSLLEFIHGLIAMCNKFSKRNMLCNPLSLLHIHSYIKRRKWIHERNVTMSQMSPYIYIYISKTDHKHVAYDNHMRNTYLYVRLIRRLKAQDPIVKIMS